MLSPYSIYIPIGIIYKDYKTEYFVSFLDSGSESCLCRLLDCFLQYYHKTLKHIKGRDISNNIIETSQRIEKPIILLGTFLIKCPPFYFHNIGTDILLGNNFLQLFHKIKFNTLT